MTLVIEKCILSLKDWWGHSVTAGYVWRGGGGGERGILRKKMGERKRGVRRESKRESGELASSREKGGESGLMRIRTAYGQRYGVGYGEIWREIDRATCIWR